MKIFRNLVSYHAAAIYSLLLTAAYSLVLLAVQAISPDFGEWTRAVTMIGVFLVVYSVLSTYRVVSLTVKILMLDGLFQTEHRA